MFRQQVRQGLTEIRLAYDLSMGRERYHWKERQLMGRIELALGTALEQGTTEVKPVKIDLLGVIAGGYVKHFAIIKINCI